MYLGNLPVSYHVSEKKRRCRDYPTGYWLEGKDERVSRELSSWLPGDCEKCCKDHLTGYCLRARVKTCTRNRLTGYCCGWGGGGGCVLKIGFRNRQFGYSFEGKDKNVCPESSDRLLLVRKGGHNVLQE